MRMSGMFSDNPDSSTDAYLKIEDIISSQGIYVCTTSGSSMYPMLRDRRDTVAVSPCRGRLKKNDIPLYRRGEQYVMHRIIKVLPDSYIIRGDNCAHSEYGITDENIIGVLTEFYRGDKHIDLNGIPYRLYVISARWSYPFRYVYYSVKGLAAELKRKIKATR